MMTKLRRIASGNYKQASEEDKSNANAVLSAFGDLEEERQANFLQEYSTNPKGFAWVRHFSEKMIAIQLETDKVNEKYRTRSSYLEYSEMAACMTLQAYIYIYASYT